MAPVSTRNERFAMKSKTLTLAAVSLFTLLLAAPASADKDWDDDGYRWPKHSRSQPKAKKSKSSKHSRQGFISPDQAGRAALARVGGRVKDVDFDYDDGYPHYDVEIIKNGREYDVKVDARSGRVRSVRRDH